jgi:hypothetical protein
MRDMNRWILCAVALTLLGTIAACGAQRDDNVSIAEEGIDSAEVVGAEASLLSVSVEGGGPLLLFHAPPTPEAVAQAAAASLANVLQPAGCLTSSVAGATATYTLNGCSGPRGLLHVTGTVVIVYSLAADGIHAAATATGLAVNGATIDVASEAAYSQSGGQKSLSVTTSGQGTGPAGHEVAREGSYTITWTDTCFTLTGTWSTVRLAGTSSTVVSGYSRCEGACPEAGSIIHTGVGGRTITVTFDGSAEASFALSGGRSGSVDLLCTPAGV